ncbi:hypothetical protein ONA91_14980 [Micromonospora sp. DR5-3]|nr:MULTISPECIES: hypothetical protein [unclassified Micromonospora]MCW3815754.1 hypothetical protein [Micromonospora sp. DR5-3]
MNGRLITPPLAAGGRAPDRVEFRTAAEALATAVTGHLEATTMERVR